MGNLTLEDVNNMYLDVLKEIGNIGAGNATTAIANMLGMKIDMNVPNVKLMEVSKLGTAVGAEDETIVGIFLEVMNDIEGRYSIGTLSCQQTDDGRCASGQTV